MLHLYVPSCHFAFMQVLQNDIDVEEPVGDTVPVQVRSMHYN